MSEVRHNSDQPISAPLRLTAITLRGIGSYVHGARLAVRPLTILCGTNGSGKSTWLKALTLLQKSSGQKAFPFRLAVNDSDFNRLEWESAALLQLAYDFGDNGEEKKEAEEFGGWGTVGLEFTAVRDLQYHAVSPDDTYKGFIWTGNTPKNTTFRLRIAYHTDSEAAREYALKDTVELVINSRDVARFESSASEDDYLFSCSRSLLRAPDSVNSPEHHVAKVLVGNEGVSAITPHEGNSHPDIVINFVKTAIHRIQELTCDLLSGHFHIGAIRPPESEYDVRQSEHATDAIARRSIGEDAQDMFLVERAFADNAMSERHDKSERPSREYSFEAYCSRWLDHLTSVRFPARDTEIRDQSASGEWLPCGYLVIDSPSPDARFEPPAESIEPENLERLANPCLPESHLPRSFSAGFHQIAPMIFQIGLMKQFESIGIENPEAHLHPDLQLQIAEFLMLQAASGRQIIVETHSDLLIRRILRAVLKEQVLGTALPQSLLQLYFTELEPRRRKERPYPEHLRHLNTREEKLLPYVSSKLRRIRLDKRNRFQWPTGFLDASLNESRHLLEAMYGPPPAPEEEP